MDYICHDLFMIRTPALPVKISRGLMNVNNYNEIFDYILKNNLEGYLKEALQVSSYSLYEALQRVNNDSKKDKGIYMSLYKYLQRASSRTTPYGLLANVCMGEFADSDKSIINLNKIKRIIKVDNFWAFSLIKDIEKDFKVLKSLSLIWNNSCYASSCRVRNPHFSDYGTAENNSLKRNSSIRYTNLVSIIRDNTQEFVNYNALVQIVQEHYPNVNKDKICDAINTLIEQEYLFTDLRVPAYCENVLEHILQMLDKYNVLSELKYKLKKIENDFKKYELPDEGNKEQLLNQILEQMKEIKIASNYIEVNSGSRFDKPFLSEEVKLKLEKFASTIANIGVETKLYNPLTKFRKQFQEEYGTNIEVPLTEIIDPCGFDGLRYYEDTYSSSSVREDKIKDIFERSIQEALINGERKAILTKEDFIDIYDENISDLRFQNSFDMNFIITKGDKGIHLTIGPNFGSSSAGKTFQRFHGVFDEYEFEKYNTIYDELDKEEECLYVELREMTDCGRCSNVINWNKNYKYFVTLGLPGTIERETEIFLSDLTVGIDDKNNLYLKSISKNKVCKMVTNNMLNPILNSKVFNLLLDISSSYDGIKVMHRMDNFLKNEYIYSPEIVIEDVTVAPAKWNFTETNLKVESFKKFKESFDFCSKRYDVDEYVYMCNGDQRLLVHRTNEIALEILYQELKEKNI
ncbi:lantibiotic dehydratase family protein [Clostridium senegalense]|uniref:lantibiotic dehydratase family protein n=1 Tax=Clostridium senegalense TaxID=1465809 RepID=UPI000289EC99|nr:lantibiotic dehydratase family protein [Clostridium senegalense]